MSAAIEPSSAPVGVSGTTTRPLRRAAARWRSLDVAIGTFAATALVTTATSLFQPQIAPIAPTPILLALAGFCAAVLARRPAPSLAWLATTAGSYAAASIPISQARAADPLAVGVTSWLGFAIPASAGAIVALAIAAGYATRPERRLPRIGVGLSLVLLVWLVIACVTTLGLIGIAHAASDPAFNWIDVASMPIASFVPFVAVVTALGIAADVDAGGRRAVERLGPARLASLGPAERAWAVAVATVQELVPGRAATVDAERTRLAGDLHAVVLPSLRRAIAEAEAGGDPDALARHLRTVDTELERLMADRWPIVLEAFGLVAAVEDLAERVEADGGPSVEIDIGRSAERPPVAVERAAWRIAQIAVENAVRHAAASTIRITISADPERVSLAVADDGVGFDPASDVVRPAARGVADARRRAEAVGGTIRVDGRVGAGTTVEFAWAARPMRST